MLAPIRAAHGIPSSSLITVEISRIPPPSATSKTCNEKIVFTCYCDWYFIYDLSSFESIHNNSYRINAYCFCAFWLDKSTRHLFVFDPFINWWTFACRCISFLCLLIGQEHSSPVCFWSVHKLMNFCVQKLFFFFCVTSVNNMAKLQETTIVSDWKQVWNQFNNQNREKNYKD
jgi:hypothetical protein